MKNRQSELLTMIPVIDDLYWIKKGNPWEYYHTAFHHHPEIQLDFIIQGNGSQLIGNVYTRFQNGDMILLGEYLPHLRRPDNPLDKKKGTFEVITLLFNRHIFSDQLLAMGEMRNIKMLLESSKRGIVLGRDTVGKLAPLLLKSLDAQNIYKITLLLEILQTIAESKDFQFILKRPFDKPMNKDHSNRLSAIYGFAMEHFTRQITIKEIAEVANLSEHSFCRYFKNNFNSSFSSFLMEIRINHACKLLVETQMPVSEICFESGFNNFANFNKAFRKLNSTTPSEYRASYKVLQ
ncbi:MAG: AraC family transcriptional regulator [Maribacter sp.]